MDFTVAVAPWMRDDIEAYQMQWPLDMRQRV
jgi:hypothetical protein